MHASPESVIKSNDRESFRPQQAASHSAEVMPSPDASAKRVQSVTGSMNISMLAPQPWLQAAEAVIDWYGRLFRLALGLGPVNSHREARGFVTAGPSPPAGQPAPVAPLQSPVAPVQSAPAPVQSARAPVALRPKRRKSLATATRRPRSSKTSRVRRGRRAA
jgi:hypothetical protein